MRFGLPYYVAVSTDSLHQVLCRSKYLFWNFPHALQTAEQVAAPQHEPPRVMSYSQVEQSVYRSSGDSNATYRAHAGQRHQR
jgi:hypothetical protein